MATRLDYQLVRQALHSVFFGRIKCNLRTPSLENMKPTAYVINLDRRPDRWARMQELWSPWFNLRKVSAVDLPGNGAGGCKMSHYMVAATFVQRNEPIIVVLEDDAVPTMAFETGAMLYLGEAAVFVDQWRIANLG